MTTAISDIRSAMADALKSIDGLRATPLQPEQINPPTAVVDRRPWDYDEVQHGNAEDSARTYLFGVRVYVGRTNERSGQNFLDDCAEPTGPRSIKETLEADSYLASITDWILVTGVAEVITVTLGAADYLAQDFIVQVAVS